MTPNLLAAAALALAVTRSPSHTIARPLLRAPVTKLVSFTPMVDQQGRPLPANVPTKAMDPK
jgi:hypothetical protein